MRQKTIALLTLLVLFLALVWVSVGHGQSLFDPKPQPQIFGGAVPQSGAGFIWPRADVVFLDSQNGLWIQRACQFGFRREVEVSGTFGTLIGIDYRPADGLLYGLDDYGVIYTIDAQGAATFVSALTLQFAGDMRSLMDFNPVVNALRLIGANDQNYAVVNSGGNLNVTVAQTVITYAAGDVNAGANPNLVGGSYTNNLAGAKTTIFYGLDYGLNTFVTIADRNAAGSSNTGGGKLQTIGNLVDFVGRRFDLDEHADIDIYTVGGDNRLIGVSRGRVFSIDLAQINSNLPLGQTQDVRVRSMRLIGTDRFIDLAVGPQVACQ